MGFLATTANKQHHQTKEQCERQPAPQDELRAQAKVLDIDLHVVATAKT